MGDSEFWNSVQEAVQKREKPRHRMPFQSRAEAPPRRYKPKTGLFPGSAGIWPVLRSGDPSPFPKGNPVSHTLLDSRPKKHVSIRSLPGQRQPLSLPSFQRHAGDFLLAKAIGPCYRVREIFIMPGAADEAVRFRGFRRRDQRRVTSPRKKQKEAKR